MVEQQGPEMVRRTYYYSKAAADALAAAVARLHHGSNGRISKAAALDALIGAAVAQLDDVERQLRESA